MKYLTLLSISLGVFLISCNNPNNSRQIEVKGVILDNQTGKPIPSARVTLLCWRKVRSDEETYDKIDTIANSQGAFRIKFDEGFKVDIGSIAPNYHPSVQEIKDVNNAINIELKLDSNTATGSLQELGQLAVFIREYNTEPSIPRTFHGIDLLDGINTQSSDSMDISIMQYSEINYPQKLITSAKGGIVPIFDNSNNTISKAPEEGYVTIYELKGNEKGFFVKCRDGKTYARLMVFSLRYDRSSPYSNGSFKDYGIMFNADLQAEGREFSSPNDLRLDYYILENL
jgi:hypothetical protein